MKQTIRELLERMKVGVLQPRFCKYTDTEGIIEFGVICHLFKAITEAKRRDVAICCKELHDESLFRAKKWEQDGGEEDGEMISYSFPPHLIVTLE
ncbi:MAG: hypothetical protein KC910_07410 [Candidatus Eremiobacteraeota bacterium]|nr:hypothetical protein [Candidatus Eremiobacteraeota bacterium]